MKTRTYTIITGGPACAVGRIVGPAVPTLSTLLNQFKLKYKYPREGAISYVEKKYESFSLMKEDNLVGHDLAELFIHWCIRDHKFRSIKKDVFYV